MTFAQLLAARRGTLLDEPWSVDRDAEEAYLEALQAAHEAEVAAARQEIPIDLLFTANDKYWEGQADGVAYSDSKWRPAFERMALAYYEDMGGEESEFHDRIGEYYTEFYKP